jgi:hypothetical protein
MADKQSAIVYESDSEERDTESEIEEETIWYLGQVKGQGLEAYQFEPRRSHHSEELDFDSSELETSDDEDDGDGDGGSDDEQNPQSEPGTDWRNPDNFCSCGHCHVDTLQHPREAVCCYSPELNLRHIHNDDGMRTCISLHSEFTDCVLNPAVLQLSLIALKNVRGDPLNLDNISHKKYRWTAYTNFTWWIYQDKLGRKNRRIIPACVIHRIRQVFPLEENEEAFVPFQEASSEEDES